LTSVTNISCAPLRPGSTLAATSMHGQTAELAGRVALVSGGGRGIGRAIALALARHGATVAVAARTSSEVRAVAAECAGGAIGIVLDVREESSCEGAVTRCRQELGGLHVLVAAAGVSSSEKFTELTLDRWRTAAFS
jgi:NAD(P)-dependent dehydrogenase (short-subunit alcohol dehydrogenase family)